MGSIKGTTLFDLQAGGTAIFYWAVMQYDTLDTIVSRFLLALIIRMNNVDIDFGILLVMSVPAATMI